MPARTRKQRHDDFTRDRIRTTQLVNRLTDHALGDDEIMTDSQVRAALGLLKKSLPDLAAHAHTGEGFTGPVLVATGVPRGTDK